LGVFALHAWESNQITTSQPAALPAGPQSAGESNRLRSFNRASTLFFVFFASHGAGRRHEPSSEPQRTGVFGWLQADTVAAVWIAAAAIHREKNTVEAAAAAGLQPQQAAANKLVVMQRCRVARLVQVAWYSARPAAAEVHACSPTGRPPHARTHGGVSQETGRQGDGLAHLEAAPNRWHDDDGVYDDQRPALIRHRNAIANLSEFLA
jgi:hypothetical protein